MIGDCIGSAQLAVDVRNGTGSCTVCLTRQNLTSAFRQGPGSYPVVHRPNVPSA